MLGIKDEDWERHEMNKTKLWFPMKEEPARISSYQKAIRVARNHGDRFLFSSPRNLDDAQILEMYGTPDKFD